MKKKNIIIQTSIAILSVMMGSVAFAVGGSHVGNGGDVYTCRDPNTQQILRWGVLEHFEASLNGWPLQIPNPNATMEEHLNVLLQRLSLMGEVRVEDYKKLASKFFQNTNFVSGTDLTDIPDSEHIALPAGCNVEQLIIYREKPLPGEKKYLINTDLWTMLTPFEKASMMMHELIYQEYLSYGHFNSIMVRFLNSLLATDRLKLHYQNSLDRDVIISNANFLDEIGMPILYLDRYFVQVLRVCVKGLPGYYYDERAFELHRKKCRKTERYSDNALIVRSDSGSFFHLVPKPATSPNGDSYITVWNGDSYKDLKGAYWLDEVEEEDRPTIITGYDIQYLKHEPSELSYELEVDDETEILLEGQKLRTKSIYKKNHPFIEKSMSFNIYRGVFVKNRKEYVSVELNEAGEFIGGVERRFDPGDFSKHEHIKIQKLLLNTTPNTDGVLKILDDSPISLKVQSTYSLKIERKGGMWGNKWESLAEGTFEESNVRKQNQITLSLVQDFKVSAKILKKHIAEGVELRINLKATRRSDVFSDGIKEVEVSKHDLLKVTKE